MCFVLGQKLPFSLLSSGCRTERALTGAEARERPPHCCQVPVCLGWPSQGTDPRAVTQLRRTTCRVGIAAFRVTTVTRSERPKEQRTTQSRQGQHQGKRLQLKKGRTCPVGRWLAYQLDPELVGSFQEPQGSKKEAK